MYDMYMAFINFHRNQFNACHYNYSVKKLTTYPLVNSISLIPKYYRKQIEIYLLTVVICMKLYLYYQDKRLIIV